MEKDQQNKFNKPSIDEEHVLDFGRHKGKALKDAPAQYLLYLFSRDICYGALKDWIRYNEEALKEREKKER